MHLTRRVGPDLGGMADCKRRNSCLAMYFEVHEMHEPPVLVLSLCASSYPSIG